MSLTKLSRTVAAGLVLTLGIVFFAPAVVRAEAHYICGKSVAPKAITPVVFPDKPYDPQPRKRQFKHRSVP